MRRILIATSNPGKLRDFAGAAAGHGIEIAGVPGFDSMPAVVEDGLTFEDNARKKAEGYSRLAPGEIVLADDSGLEVDALNGAPGIHSARYAADQPHLANENTDDEANNARVLRELRKVPAEKRTGRFVCVLVAARDGQTLASFRGAAEGVILELCAGHRRFWVRSAILFSGESRRHLLSSVQKRRRDTAIGARRFGSFWCGATRNNSARHSTWKCCDGETVPCPVRIDFRHGRGACRF